MRKKRRAPPKRNAKPQILCAVCGKADGKYKCPKCRAPFCCVQCSKDHKNTCPALVSSDDKTNNNNATPTTDADGDSSAAIKANKEQSNYLHQKELKTTNQTKRKRARRNSGDESDDSRNDEPGWSLTPEMKKTVHQSPWLRKELRDGGLRQLIEQIDAASDDDDEADDDDDDHNNNNNTINRKRISARSNGNVAISARELALARTKHSHPKFKAFVDQLMVTAGVLQPSKGDTILDLLEGGQPSELVLAPVPRRGGGTSSEVESDSSGSDDSSSSEEDSEDDGSGSPEDDDGTK